MQIHTGITALKRALTVTRSEGKTLALVPTMGNLHDGHISLVEQARRDNDVVVVSIFVNPLQFGPNEDFETYPRTQADDEEKLSRARADLVFAPAVDDIYPKPIKKTTNVTVPGLTSILCGAHRPGHFDGVTTVVNKLFNIVAPDRAYFGNKDYQQLVVIRTMVEDLNMPLEVIGVPTLRDDDGLALSSRNAYLSSSNRTKARGLYQTLSKVKTAIESGDNRSYDEITANARSELERHGFVPDYVEVLERKSLESPQTTSRHLIVLGAGSLGRTRLIDNLAIDLT